MKINQIRCAIQLILSSGDTTAKKDVEIIISTLENENKIRFNIAMNSGYKKCYTDHSDKIKKIQEKRRKVLIKYDIEPF